MSPHPDPLPATDPALRTERVGQTQFTRIEPPPDMPLRALLEAIEGLGALVAAGATSRFLIDMRQLTHIGEVENVLLSHHCGQYLRGARVAVLVRARTGQGQAAARGLGLDMRSFTEENWAVDWLQEP